MVHELDLTDQDVTIIADRIDSEIRSHIPEWSPTESFADESVFDSHASEIKDDASPFATTSVLSGGSLILEQMPSGRKFWLESPKTVGGQPLSPVKSSPLTSLHSQSEEDSEQQTPGDENIPEDEWLDPEFVGEQQQAIINDSGSVGNVSCCDSQNGDLNEEKQVQVLAFSGTDTSEDNDTVLGCIESEEVRVVANKLERLLEQQQKELDKLRLKHELSVSDLLKELPHKVRCKVFKLCRYKIPDYRMHCERHLYAENASIVIATAATAEDVVKESSSESNSSSVVVDVSSPSFRIGTYVPATDSGTIRLSKVKNAETGAEDFVVGPIIRGLSNLKRGSKPDLGIAVILNDDAEKS